MQKHFNQEMDDLRTTLQQMVNLVDDQLTMAIAALESGNTELCRVIKERDKQADAYENLVQVQCENLFALFQPVAVDLRAIITALNISSQVERCGDIAVNIANRTCKTAAYHELVLETQVVSMARQAHEMLQQVISSYTNMDGALARSVLAKDDIVDGLNKSIFKFLVEKMKGHPELIEPCAHLIVLAKQLERLADHTTNIAENVIFLIEARIVAHQQL
jgi:phosphate transport system protein